MKDSRKYYRDIKKLFPINSKKEKNYLHQIKEQIEEYEDILYKELENQFGSPIEIVKSYYETIDSNYLLKKINLKRTINATCLIALILIAIYFGYRTYLLSNVYNNYNNSIPTEIEEIIEEE